MQLDLVRDLPLGRQLERRLRDLIRTGGLALGARLPSTRSLAADLGVSRGVVVGVYAQLAAEGYVTLRRGALPTVAARGREPLPVDAETRLDVPIARARFNLRPDLPDLALFPRRDWLATERRALRRAANTDLAYGEPFGAFELRRELAGFLMRTRGAVGDADRVNVTAGSGQALFVLALLLRNRGVRRLAVEDPGHRWRTRVLEESGLELVPVPVDEGGLDVDALPDVAAVVLAPDHHYPSGVSLAPERRRALIEWAVAGDRLIVELDFDGHFRYAGPFAGALQAFAPEHVVYVGSASALLAPTLRLGWALLPAALIVPFAELMMTTVGCTARLSQLALADFIASGCLDRQLRKARAAYLRRRDVMVETIAKHMPDSRVGEARAGLFAHVSLETDEAAVLAAARARGIALDGVNENSLEPRPPGLVVGFAAEPEARLRRAVRELAAACELS